MKQSKKKRLIIEPKFKNAQWIVWQDKCYKVNYNGCGYELIDQDNLSTSLEYGTVDNYAHLWSIQDAKAGDVLTNKHSNTICIFRRMKPLHYDLFDSYCELHDNKHFGSGFDFNVDGFKPAAKEERDTLFSKMKEAGYEWDAEKKELKRIENEIEIPFGAKDSELQEVTYYIPKGFHAEIEDDKVVIKQGEQKPVDFSDLRTWKYIVDAVWTEKEGIGQYLDSPFTEKVAKKLQKRFGNIEQKPVELAKGEDYGIDGLYAAIDILQKTLGKVEGYQTDDGILEHKCAIEAVNRLYKQKPAWSEEDENGLDDALWAIEQAMTIAKDENDMGNLWYAERWLKSLKERVSKNN